MTNTEKSKSILRTSLNLRLHGSKRSCLYFAVVCVVFDVIGCVEVAEDTHSKATPSSKNVILLIE